MKNRHLEKEEELLRKPIERVSVSYEEGLNDILVQERIEKGWNNRAVESPEKTNKQIVKENVFTYFSYLVYCSLLPVLIEILPFCQLSLRIL